MKRSKTHAKIMCKNGSVFANEKHIYSTGGIVAQISKVFRYLPGVFSDKESSQVVVNSLNS